MTTSTYIQPGCFYEKQTSDKSMHCGTNSKSFITTWASSGRGRCRTGNLLQLPIDRPTANRCNGFAAHPLPRASVSDARLESIRAFFAFACLIASQQKGVTLMSDRRSHTPSSRRQFLLSVGATGGSLALASALPLRQAFAADTPPAINLGQEATMTGSAAEFGPYYRDAVQLAVNHINTAAKEVFGGPIIANHITVDSGTLPTVAVQAARQMIDTQHTPVVVCGWSSGVTVAVATSVTIPSGVLQIANGATSPLISVLPADAKADLLFRTCASDALQGVVAAQLVAGKIDPKYKYEKVSTIYINNPYGQGLSNSFAAAFQKLGGKVLAQVPHPEEVQPTYKSMLSQALKDKPDLLIIV